MVARWKHFDYGVNRRIAICRPFYEYLVEMFMWSGRSSVNESRPPSSFVTRGGAFRTLAWLGNHSGTSGASFLCHINYSPACTAMLLRGWLVCIPVGAVCLAHVVQTFSYQVSGPAPNHTGLGPSETHQSILFVSRDPISLLLSDSFLDSPRPVSFCFLHC